MKPLSERIKEFPNNQFVEWLCLACVDVREVRTPDDAQEEINKIRDAVTERFAMLEDNLRIKQNHIRLRDSYIEELERRAEEAEAKYSEVSDWYAKMKTRMLAAEAKLAELEKQASEQKPFMYGIMTANGDAHFEDFCVSSDAGLLEDVIWEWNNTLADNEPKNRVVALFTRPAPAINLEELVPDEMTIDSNTGTVTESGHVQAVKWWNACRAAILRNIEEAG